MALKMKNFNIVGVYQFLGEGGGGGERGHKKAIYRRNCLKSGAWTICRGPAKKEGGGCF